MTKLPTWDDLQEEGYVDPHAGGPETSALESDPAYDWGAEDETAVPPLSNRDRAQARNYRPAYERPKRKPAAEREEAFNALLWVVDGATGFIEELRHSDLGLSEEFWVHAAATQREGLLTLRALIDQFIAATDSHTPNRDPATRPGQSDYSGEADRPTQPTPRPRRGGINVDF